MNNTVIYYNASLLNLFYSSFSVIMDMALDIKCITYIYIQVST